METQEKKVIRHPIERVTTWVGSVYSLMFHTLLFTAFFVLAFTGVVEWNTMLLVLTTLVSLEAIYFSIFIQMTVNRHSESLREVEANVDEIQEDIDEIQEDVEEMSEDIEEMVEEEADEAPQVGHVATLETLATDLHKILADLEQLKKGK